MSTTVSYKGNTIATLNNETKTLTTAGTWVEADITVTDTSGGSGTEVISVIDTLDSHGGTIRTITAIDISDTDAEAEDVAQGKYFYTADGVKTEGTANNTDILADYLANTDNLIINSNATKVKPNGITGGKIKEINLPECITLENGAIKYAEYTNNLVHFSVIDKLYLPKVQSLGDHSLCGLQGTLDCVVLPSLKTKLWTASNGKAFDYNTSIKYYDFGNSSITTMNWGSGMDFYRCGTLVEAIILRYGGVMSIGSTNVFNNTNTGVLPLGDTCFIYVPSSLLQQYQTATNWATLYASYPNMFKTIEGSQYENYYADGTPIS